MSRAIFAVLLTLTLAACHTTDFGRSIGWPVHERTSR